MTTPPLSDSAIFRAAANLSPDQRSEFLDEACGPNDRLREEVESLLRAHDPDGSFLQSPALVVTERQPVSDPPGTMIGAYKLREQIGEGGFGVVYVAEQETPVRRKVALKVIKPGMDTKDVIARFEAERQALALMDHPNVARVFDAGTTDNGRPYFVMELVQGVTITEFCDRNRLAARQRVELFADVCRAVQHAHQKGIIHRDLKPSNIMITLHDGKPVVKVIDFGVSKALSQQLTEKTIYTAYGQMIGTPSYMSPEQAEMSGLGIDTRSDIYSLGVLLYELLTGQTPLDANRLRASGYAEIMRIIREEEPPRPSMKISTLGETATVIAQSRQTDPDHLRRDLTGELDWIVMKCLEKDRARRYETANALARDIERYLHDEPVEACPPSTWYRMSKFARKHRSLIVTVASFMVLLAAGGAISIWLAVRATQAEGIAQAARADLEQSLNNEQTARREADAARQKAVWNSQRLNTATKLANEGIEFYYLKNIPAALDKFAEAAEVEKELNTIYLYRRMLYTDIGLWDRAAADYAQSFRLVKRNHWQTCYEHTLLQYYIGDEPSYRAACEEFLRQYGQARNSDIRQHLLHACCLSPGPVLEAADLNRRAEILASASDKPWHRSAVGMAFLRAGNFDKAIEIYDELLVSGANSPGGIHRVGHGAKALALHGLGHQDAALEELRQFELAIEEWTKVIGQGPAGTMPINWYDWLEALMLYREAKTKISGSPPAEDPRLVTLRQRALEVTETDVHIHMKAGREAIERQDWDAAAASYERAIDKLPHSFGQGPQYISFYVEMVERPEVFQRLIDLGADRMNLWYAHGLMLANQRKWSQAADDCTKSLEFISEWESQRPGPFIVQSLAALYLLAGDEKGYHELCERIIHNSDHIDDPFDAGVLSRVCTLKPAADSDGSIPTNLAEQALSSGARVAWHIYGVGAAHYRTGRYEEAISRLRESLEHSPGWGGRAQNHVMLAMAYYRLGLYDEAHKQLQNTRSALKQLEQNIGSGEYGFADSSFVNDWLAIQVLIPEAEKLLNENDHE